MLPGMRLPADRCPGPARDHPFRWPQQRLWRGRADAGLHLIERGVPILGICYGMQLLGHYLGGVVAPSQSREYGPAQVFVKDSSSPLFEGACSAGCLDEPRGPVEAAPPVRAAGPFGPTRPPPRWPTKRGIFTGCNSIQRWRTPRGMDILRNFCLRICGCHGDWTVAFLHRGEHRGHSPGWEMERCSAPSPAGWILSVVAKLVSQAVGNQLTAVCEQRPVAQGRGRENMARFRRYLGGNLVYVDATDRFLKRGWPG